jgi:ParB family chromosome partitioning protein
MALDLSFKQLIDAAEDVAAPTGQPTSIAIDRIDEDPDQPRHSFDEQKLEELAESVRQHVCCNRSCCGKRPRKAGT